MRHHAIFHRSRILTVCCVLLFFILRFMAAGCSSAQDDAEGATVKSAPTDTSGSDKKADSGAEALRDNTPAVLTPEASGTTVYGDDTVTIDASHTSEGYVMVNYSGDNEKVKFQVKTPDGTEYTYLVTDYGNYAVYPLPGGNGSYTLTLLEVIQADKDLYAIAFTQQMDVEISNEFSPFLYPNKYVAFTADSKSVAKGKKLAADCGSDLEVIANIYNYVIKNVSYDDEKAENVSYGYTPDADETLSSKKGICFDYAALMCAMLRTQRIPTRLEVGYAGDAYHAWISCSVAEIGWINDIIEFDGTDWTLMDPTYAASHNNSSVKKYIGDGSRYVLKYTY